MHLDPVTLMVVLSCVSLVSGAFLTFLRVTQPDVGGMGSMAASMFAFALGFGLIAARSLVPNVLSFTVANALICGGYLLTVRGYRLFGKRQFYDSYALISFVFYVSEFSYFYHVADIFRIRLFFYHTTYTIVCVALVYETLSDFRSSGHKSHLVALAFAGFMAALLAGMAVLAFGYTDAVDILSITRINVAVLLGQIFFVVGWTLSFALIVTERAGYHDALTGLPNRRMLNEALSDAVRSAKARGASFPLFLLDLDRFKEVNDTLGHLAGDELLKRVGDRIARALAGRRSLVARLGGDEFAVIIPDAEATDARADAERISRALRDPIAINGLHLVSSASVGVAIFPTDGDDAASLLRCADVAMYTAKRSGIHVAPYSAEADSHSAERLTTLAELNDILRRETRDPGLGEFTLRYQPIIRLDDEAVTGMEALVRWNHPKHGLMLPGSWLPLLEMSDLIEDLTAWVLDGAIRQARSWRDKGHEWSVKINVSARNLVDAAFPGVIVATLDRYGVAPGAIELEITEIAMTANPDRAFAILRSVTDLGIRVSVDDFGAGRASFSTLRRVPGLAAVKIDRAFVRRMADDRADAAVVTAVIALARDLGIRSVAEGVEDERTLILLKNLGCVEAQGFHVARPMRAEATTEWWARRSVAPAFGEVSD